MKILVLPGFYPSATRPRTGSFFQDQVEALRRAGYAVDVLVAPRIRETLDAVRRLRRWPVLTDEGGQVYRMHRGWFPRVFPRICGWLHTQAIQQAFEQYGGQPDIIHAHNTFYAGVMAARLREAHGIPVLLTEHSSNFLVGRVFLPGQHALVRRTLAQVDQVTTVGPALAEALRAYAVRSDIDVIGNLVDTDYFTPAEPPPDTPFVFCATVRPVPVKRIDVMLKAFAQAFGDDRTVQLVIAGDVGKHRQLATELGINVRFVGWLDRDGIREFYRRSHAIVSSSQHETFGLSLVEAMSCGTPAVATRSGGADNLVTQETGLLVPVDDVAALAEALVRMRETHASYDRDILHDYCVQRFSEASFVRLLERHYADVTGP